MKRLLAMIAAAALLCGILCGCSKTAKIENSGFLLQTQDGQTPHLGSDPEMQAALTNNRNSEIFGGDILLASSTALALHMTINPEVLVFVDQYGAIITVQSLNEEARALVTKANAEGKSVQEGLAALLAAAHAQGFFQEGTAALQIEPSVHNGLNWTAELEAALTKIVTDFEAEEKLQIELTVMQPEISQTSGSFAQQDGAVSVKEWTNYDSGAHITAYYDEQNRLVRSIVEKSDGDIEKYTVDPETGNTISLLWIHAEGSYSETFFDENGVQTYRYHQDSDGNYTESSFSDDGSPVESVYHCIDGSTDETYYENGKRTHTIFTAKDGSVQESFYSENGLPTLTTLKEPNGNFSEWTYYASGVPAKYIFRDEDGYYSETEYYDTASNTEGDNTIVTASQVKVQIYEGTDGYSETHYREDGSESYYYYKDADSSYETTTDENGVQYATCLYFSGDITCSQWQTDASGYTIYTKDIYSDGSVTECWYSGDEITKMLVNGEEQPLS